MYEKYAVLINEKGITSYKVSKDTGISTATLSDWKQGRSKPKIDKLMILAKYFDVPLEHFIETDVGKK
ncbi:MULTISPECIES: helix-turn-helix transcriptional regulator [unclassified Breznakia]|uniref:helix-turn-helix domain-containing protein n=1 Tax=unclassified Breznakia TaxID=2623764 RepID=UPI0024759E4D|nr:MULTISPECIES: helix-turn-helix transcriptional regulator [unclassified Breznakia]MDH6367164.1 transcriptional regulator with XRE-family HTH domain [Breznakia sp. PH1-1]MDH6404416.1 transcriptional regulator with XRE-family HTH domain [Breznakia sp. PF1-11]MDH6412125.1 transcriptional regulator with XRE-family HTH domain [Breznakia sp. PFB1-11]MDH6414404.1 transcriptional regulator with XRE-family HTH domain [Breznakia sp. PFB1-14]MDH6416666.1 transcriptional regulator with XRE-family HTH do